MKLKLLLLVLFTYVFSYKYTYSCDGMSVSVLSNTYLGNGVYEVTIEYCEWVSNGGSSAVTGIIIQTNGANILGTSTPSFTSNATGTVINYSLVNSNTAEWGSWDNNPAVTPFLRVGDPTQCVTIVLQTDAEVTSISIAGSSSSSNDGSGYSTWMGRYTCNTTTSAPAVVCSSAWSAPILCEGDNTPIDLNNYTSANGVFSGSGIDPATGIFNPATATFPASVTLNVGDAQFNCQTTHVINPVSLNLQDFPDQTICQGESVQLDVTATGGVSNCNYTLVLNDSGSDGWTGGASVDLLVNGNVQGNYTISGSASSASFTIPVSTNDVITFSYNSGANNNQNTINLNNTSGNNVYSQSNPSGGTLPGSVTVVCLDPDNTYSWTPSTGLSNTTSPIPIASPTTTTTYNVTVTNPASGCQSSESITVTVNTPQPPVFDPFPDICQNDPQPTLPATSNNGINGSWSPSSIDTSTPGTYTLTFTPDNTNSCPSDPITQTLTVLSANDPLCAPPCNATAGNDGPYCQGATINLSGSGGGTYSWTGPNGFSSSQQNPTLPNATPTMSGTYTLTIDDNGCIAVSTTTVTVNPSPSVNGGADQTICNGTSVTLTASGNAASYVWNNGISNGVAFTPTSTATYTVTGTSSAGCTNTDQVTVTVNPLPNVSAGNDFTVCTSSTITLSGSGASGYTWNNGVTDGVPFIINGTTTYEVTGTDAFGCQNTDNITVTVNTNAPINAGTDLAICEGASTTLVASGGVSYTWDNNLGTGASHTISPTATTTYTVSGTDANGCTGTDQVTITVHPNPITTITGDNEYCQGFTAQIDAGSGFANYLWSNGATTQTTPVTTADNPISVTVYTTEGCSYQTPDYTVSEVPQIQTSQTLSICQGASAMIHGNQETAAGVYPQVFTSANGCDSTSTITLIVNPLPNVQAGTDQTVCAGTSITLNGTGATSYVWDNSVTDGVSFTPGIGTTTYTVTGTDNNGCQNTDNLTVTAHPLPTATISGTASVCINATSPVVTFTGAGGTAPYTFTYNIDGGASQTITTPSGSNSITIQVPTGVPGVFTYNLENVEDASVSSCSQLQSNSVSITVHDQPTVFAGNDISVCEGETVILSASGATSYSWDNGVNNGVSFTPNQTTTYTVTGTSQTGCSNTDQVTVTVNAIPDVQFSGDVLAGCSPVTTVFSNLSTGNGANCVWNFGNGQTASGCGSVSSVYNGIGCYDVSLTVTSSAGCTATSSVADYICVEPDPIAEFSADPDHLSTINLTSQMVNTSYGADSYVWDFGDGSGTSTDFSPSHTFPDETGTYTITLTVFSDIGCSDVTEQTITMKEELLFYVPNTFTPDNDDYNEVFKPIFTSGYDPFNYHLTIFNRWGEILFESYDAEFGWDGTYGGTIVQDGTYIWKITVKKSYVDDREEFMGHINLIR